MSDVREATLARSRIAEFRPQLTAAVRSNGPFTIVIEHEVGRVARLARETPHAATVFQTEAWIGAWYEHLGPTVGEPVVACAFDRSGALAAMLPLVRRNSRGLRIIEFADHGVSDSNAPLLGPAAPVDAAGAEQMWDTLRQSLDADVVRFTKMPPHIEGRANPLALLPAARPSTQPGNVLVIDGRFENYLASLKGMLRKQLRKTWRLFGANEGASFRRIDDPDEALKLLAELDRQQGARLRAQGQSYCLDQPEFAAFYQAITADGVADGSVVLTALMHHEEVVAALVGLARGDTYVMVRIASGSDRWANCSPGRLVIAKTIETLHAEGFRVFDFSVGGYPYKRRLGGRHQPLYDLTVALTLRGMPLAAYDRVKQFVREHPALYAFVRRLKTPRRAVEADDRD